MRELAIPSVRPATDASRPITPSEMGLIIALRNDVPIIPLYVAKGYSQGKHGEEGIVFATFPARLDDRQA